jgi:hypothetical protein
MITFRPFANRLIEELSMSNGKRVGPSWWYCVLGGIVMLAGAGLFAYVLLHGISHVTDGLTQIVAPGEKDLTLMPKQKYTIFLETKSVVDGRIYSTQSVSGLNCTVTSQTSGTTINTYRPGTNTTYSVGGRHGSSVLEFFTEKAGVYRVACAYGAGVHGPQVVVAVGSGVSGRIYSTIIESFASIFGGFILGGAIILTVVILRARAERRYRPAQSNTGLV